MLSLSNLTIAFSLIGLDMNPAQRLKRFKVFWNQTNDENAVETVFYIDNQQ